ncbi:nucleotidyltransferase [Aliarcobacter butzleri]|uniref:nucleotidyltransferase n=1 Tax=Aliarcobacter butzleri TaxID=28197 RepID=UPI003BB1E996
MASPQDNILSNEDILNDLVESLEISSKVQEKAENRYKSLGDWLDRESSSLKKYEPQIYSQGSIRLGTVIRPLNEDGEYDLDSVCVLKKLNVSQLSQKKLKELIGIEIKAYVKANNFNNDMKEGKRCFTIEYADEEQFHMDILPSVPDEEGFISYLNENHISDYSHLHTDDAISITDNTLANYDSIDMYWNKSNPIGYSKWFAVQCNKSKSRIFNKMISLSENVEELPIFTNKSILQKVIMILKCHRDNMYKENSDIKPISIIITTLAAEAYDGSDTLSEALNIIISNMEDYIEYNDGICKIRNPVNPIENFADKWETEPVKQKEFFAWLKILKQDFAYLNSNLTVSSLLESKAHLQNRFGSRVINQIFEKNQILSESNKKVKENLLSLAHVKKPNWFMNLIGGKNSRIYITCKANRASWSMKSISSNEQLDKNWDLLFTVHFPKELKQKGLKYYWQVANSGSEAISANCLRGDIIDSDMTTSNKGGKTWKEYTAYSGYHFVRCFLVLNGQCIGQSEPFLVNIK